MRKIGLITVLLLGAVLLLIVLPPLTGFYVDWLWFNEVQYEQIFLTLLKTRFAIWLAVFLVCYLFLYLNWRVADKVLPVVSRRLQLDPEGAQVIDIGRHTSRIGKPLALVVAFLTAQTASQGVLEFITYLHAAPFGETDPLFGRDLSFYLFTLPVWERLTQLGLWLVGLSWAVVLSLAWVREAVRMEPKGLWVARAVRGQLGFLGILFFILFAFASWLRIPNLLYSSRGPILGASYTDLHVVLPALWLLVASCLVGALLILLNHFRKRRFLVLAAPALCLLVLILGLEVIPNLVQKLIVAPDELTKETPFIRNNIAATRRAFGIDSVAERDLTGEGSLSRTDIENNAATLRNVRLWDHKPLLDTFAQIQEIRTYYDFVSVDNDRYVVGSESRQMMLSPRELAPTNLPDRRWLNEHLTYTHGFGLTMGPVNQVTSDGLPVLLVKDIPPVSSVKSISVSRPEIYFGENTSQYVFVRTNNEEFNYPSGEKNVYASYQGKGGVLVASLWRKALLAFHLQSVNILTSPLITAESRVLLYREIRERISKVAPFLALDGDPYMVVTSEGKLIWILDAYTVTNRYPYAQRSAGGINYIRNSVKAIVDAYDGTVQFYLVDPTDPIARTLAQAFPGLFLPYEKMNEDLRSHLRYPEDLFSLQTTVYSTYHMDQPQVFYNREDQWEIPMQAGRQERMAPYYTIMKLPGEKREEFILMLPFTPRGKDNLSAWIVGRCDPANYGKLVAYRFPKQKLVFGPKQIENRISQDTVISQEITLWDQRGSQVIPGTLLVIPVEESLIYIRPLYIRAEGGKIPELKRVVVAYENRIAMAATLEEALEQVFGNAVKKDSLAPAPTPGLPVAGGGATQPESTPSTSPLAAEAILHYQRAIEAQRQGNWATYGEEIRKVGELLQKMQQRD